MLLNKFYPHAYVNSVFSIDYQKLYDKGYRGLLFDIDNTLVHHGKDSTEEVDALFLELHQMGFQTLLLSNNDEERIKRFMRNIDSLYIDDADKPNPTAYAKALEMMNLSKEQVICIGDQLFTDILGANRSGIDSILVRYLRYPDETKIGIRRHLEKVILRFYRWSPSYRNRLGDIQKKEVIHMPERRRRLFCELHPACYAISMKKENCKRHLKNLLSKEKFAKTRQTDKLPNVISVYSNYLIKKGKDIDPVLQENKAMNIDLACRQINGIVIHPGETFSFWKTVGNTSRRRGYKDGRVIRQHRITSGIGGGLCNLGNTIHLLVLHSPLEVTEIHYHSDALAPDEGKRVPLSAGTSVCYNHIDYRFRNTTDQDIQLILWVENQTLYAELRSQQPFPWRYELEEEGHRFCQENGKYYRVSKIYRRIFDRNTGADLKKELVWDNHSEVMFDYDLIPKEQIMV